MERKQALERIAELADELNRLQQRHLNEVDTYERHNLLEDIAEEAEEALVEEFGAEEFDGQPDEAQEWYDFDPDC